tara:strand:- start:323 stop:466 length:144 start_codon:yes stop_codon:yes gene_type:complete
MGYNELLGGAMAAASLALVVLLIRAKEAHKKFIVLGLICVGILMWLL